LEPIYNNNEPPKPSDLGTLSQDQSGGGSGIVALPDGLTEQAVIAFAKARNSAWDAWFGPKLRLIEENRTLWRNLKTSQVSNRASAQIPMAVAYGIVESVDARLNNTLMNRPKFVEAVAEEISSADKQRIVEDFVNQELVHKMRKPTHGKACIKAALLDGYTIARSVWRMEPVEKTEAIYAQDPITGVKMYMGENASVTMKEGWDFEKKSAGNMAWDINTTTRIQDSEWVRERAYMSFNQLKRWEQEGRVQNVDRLKNIVPSGLSGTARDDYEKRLKRASGDDKWRTPYADDKFYQIDEWYCYLTYTDAATEQVRGIKAHFFLVESEHLFMFEENVLNPKRHPYVSAVTVQDPESVAGFSVLEAVKPLLEAINAYSAKNQLIVDWCSNPTIFYGNKSGLSGRTTFSRPMGMQPVLDASDIKEFVPNPTSVKVIQGYIAMLITQAREATGANEQFQGINGSDTATEFQGLQAAAGSRFADIADNLNQGLIEALAQECYWFYRQFGVDGQMVVHPQSEETGAQLMSKEMLAGEYRFNSASVTTENYKLRQVADDTSFIKMMIEANNGGMLGGTKYNLPKHITEISLPLRGQKSSKDMFVTAPSIPVPLPAPVNQLAQANPMGTQ
jgi:hypothetical protein